MKDPDVTSLFKYKSINEQTLQLLINMKIWLVKPQSFNDPFETKMILNPDYSLEDYYQYIDQTYVDYPDEIEKRKKPEIYRASSQNAHKVVELNQEKFQNVGVFSMSSTPSNLLMWAHYADEHKGICIEFERASTNPLGSPHLTHKVVYQEMLPIVGSLDFLRSLRLVSESPVFITKSEDWRYEKEWRFIKGRGEVEEPIPGRIKSVCFGLRTPDKHKELIYNILRHYPDIEYKQAVQDPCSYSLSLVEHKFNVIDWHDYNPQQYLPPKSSEGN